MHIISLTAENVQKLKLVSFKPPKDIVEIVGENAAGKSALLDSIWMALDGATAAKGKTQIIRTGANQARIRLELGNATTELTVERLYFADKPTVIRVYDEKGGKREKPQQILDGLIGAISLDPMKFTIGMDPQAQYDQLLKIAKVDLDFAQLDRLNKTDFEKRTEINREHKALLAQVEAITVPDDLPAKPVDTAALTDELMAASDFNAKLEKKQENRTAARKRVADIPGLIERVKADAATQDERARQGWTRARDAKKAEIAALEARILAIVADIQSLDTDVTNARIQAETDRDAAIASLETEAKELQQKLDTAQPLQEAKDPAAIREQITEAQETNEGIRKRTRHAELTANAAAKAAEAQALTDAMQGRDDAKATAIREAELPIPGLGFGTNEVYFDGVPLSQASHAQKIRIGMAVAMATNPTLKVIRIGDAGLLDAKSWQIVVDTAREHGFQVWLEELTARGDAAIEIVDGEIRAPDDEPVQLA